MCTARRAETPSLHAGIGQPADEPVAVVCKATYEDQQVLMSTLTDCAQDVEAAGLTPPSLIVVGDVVPLREQLNWNG